MAKQQHPVDVIGQFEAWALTAVMSLGEQHAYGMTIHREVERLSKRPVVSLGAIYTTLERLDKKGMVSSRFEEDPPERGGRVRKFFKIEASGEAALDAFVSQASVVSKTLESIRGLA